ncbi:Bestrophin, RFP-TM, chloride channel [Rhizoctonia solani]|uniref:Bestrophin, RFP-TM, chloride channel n=1 Tax=Rhizoctonia solani TaxID=456999 RepID=A0A8H7H784_9AGAM|nr:Bestrophin, RFP-TM, chloride channel [Rhizoctonia solani]
MSTRTDLIHDLSQSKKLIPWMCRSILATALFRCWYLIVLITAWAACVSIINDKIRNLSIQPTLLTAFGTILGFVISYRTSSAFERYNEGRRLWSTIILASRTFSRTVWFHIPDEPKIPTAASRPPSAAADATLASHEGQPTGLRLARARVLIEKRTTINLIEAFSIAVKHYLRGEDGIYYEDLYKLVKFLPAYALPNSTKMQDDCECSGGGDGAVSESPVRGTRQQSWTSGSTALPELPDEVRITIPDVQEKFVSPRRGATLRNHTQPNAKQADGQDKEPVYLYPSKNPPKWAIHDIWPLSLLIQAFPHRFVSGKTAARLRRTNCPITLNVPLEITFYLSSYIAALQHRQAIDVPTTNTLLLGLNQLVDSLSGLERILTTPIPFSYGTQLWISCFLYLGVLPFQLWQSMGYITIPATAIASFIFFGFLAAGEEIENLVIQSCITISQRFRTMAGYDKNDLDMDYFCKILIRAELDALMSVPVPKPEEWAFSEDNNYLFESDDAEIPGRSPEEWLEETNPEEAMRNALKTNLNPKGVQRSEKKHQEEEVIQK